MEAVDPIPNPTDENDAVECEHERTSLGHHHDQPSWCLDCNEEL
jgi:hypothetical protein